LVLWQRPGVPPLLLELPLPEDEDEEELDEPEELLDEPASATTPPASACWNVGSSTQPSSETMTATDRPNRRRIFGLSHAGPRSC
jgi:hypothetical protein